MPIMHWDLVMDLEPGNPVREQLMFEQWMRDLEDESLAAAAALEIQARLIRMARELDDAPPLATFQTPVPYESQDKAEQMACFISSSYEKRLTIPQIAAEVDLHPDYAATLFKKTFGTTILNFITRHRIAHAQRLLLSTDDQIINIAGESGFESLSRFNRSSTTSQPSPESSSTVDVTQVTQDNSKMAERSMEAQQSAVAGEVDASGIVALDVSTNTTIGNLQIASARLGELNWNPLTVSAFQLRDAGQDENDRLSLRRASDLPMLVQKDLSQSNPIESNDYSSFAEPVKWTVISTGVVIWAVRLGHIITTFASTASAWVYFDPLRVIQTIKEKTNSDDHVTEAMFDAKQKSKAAKEQP